MRLHEEIGAKLNLFTEICREHSVGRLYAFGSAVSHTFDPSKSDYDFLVSINENDPLERGEKILSLWEKLELFFDRKIDLVTESSIKNPILKTNIDLTKVILYDGENEKTLTN
jgi:uncharacterized protein